MFTKKRYSKLPVHGKDESKFPSTLRKFWTFFLFIIIPLAMYWVHTSREYLTKQSRPDVETVKSTEQPTMKKAVEPNTLFTSMLNELQLEALVEVGLPREPVAEESFQYPVLPISGYRACLKEIYPLYDVDQYSAKRYMGVAAPEDCEDDCTLIDIFRPFVTFDSIAMEVCTSGILYCGVGSSMLCGLLAMFLRTRAVVHETELRSWPSYMRDFDFTGHVDSQIEHNHRLFFDRHTIQASHPLLKSFYNVGHGQKGFNVFEYTCNTHSKNRLIPVESGNMGDILPSYLAAYWSAQLELNYSVQCESEKRKKLHPLSVALIGSIALSSSKVANNVVLGPGVIRSDRTKGITIGKGTYILGVRGTRTRDEYVLHHGLNPTVVGDPGTWLSTVFETEIEQARSATKNKKEVCFLAHSVDYKKFGELFPEYANVTINAQGNIKDIVQFLATCKAIVSSSLHGVVFSHSLSIPAAVITVSNRIIGGDWKYTDYYYGMNMTEFRGRYRATKKKGFPNSTEKWVELVNQFPQPEFPFQVPRITFELFKAIFS